MAKTITVIAASTMTKHTKIALTGDDAVDDLLAETPEPDPAVDALRLAEQVLNSERGEDYQTIAQSLLREHRASLAQRDPDQVRRHAVKVGMLFQMLIDKLLWERWAARGQKEKKDRIKAGKTRRNVPAKVWEAYRELTPEQQAGNCMQPLLEKFPGMNKKRVSQIVRRERKRLQS